MNMNVKKVFGLLSGMFLLLCWPIMAYAAESDKMEFVGSREIEYVVSISDIENYADGGRSGFNISLRQNIPDDVRYDMYSVGRDIHINISFDFESKEEYCHIVSALCGDGTNIICPETEELLLIETFNAYEYLNFMFESVYTEDVRTKMKLNKNLIQIGESDYSFEDCVDIRPSQEENSTELHADQIFIYTWYEESAFQTRIYVELSEDYENEQLSYLKKKFRQVGDVETQENGNGQNSIQVEFSTCSEKNTYGFIEEALDCLVFYDDSVQQTDEGTLLIKRTLYFDVKDMLSEDGTFGYEFVGPEYYENIISGEGCSLSVNNSLISEAEMMTYSFEKEFSFIRVEVKSDLSDFWGKIKRTITLTAEKNIDCFYHDEIKGQLGDRLVNGSVLTITEDKENVYYAIAFSSYSTEEVAEFTKSVLKSKGTLSTEVSLFGAESEITDKYSFERIVKNMSPAEEVNVIYILPQGAEISKRSIKNATQLSDGSIMFSGANCEKISIVYDFINWRTILGIGLVCVVVAVGVVCLVWKLKRKKKIENNSN